MINKASSSIKNKLIFIVPILLYIIVSCLCLIKTCDDLMWSNIDSLKQMLMSCNPNGRYFTNIITYLMCKSEVISFVIYTLGIGLFFYLFQRFFSEEIKNKWMCFLLIGLLLLFTPRYFYVHGQTGRLSIIAEFVVDGSARTGDVRETGRVFYEDTQPQ